MAAAGAGDGSPSKGTQSNALIQNKPKLPFLPGYNVEIPTRKNFHKSHIFEVKQGVRAHKEQGLMDQPYARGASITSTLDFSSLPEDWQKDMGKTSKNFQASAGALPMSALPPWVAYDRKVLRFYAYFKESVHSSAVENFRVRRCIIYYYLEDGSLHIAEPKVENSGIPQGVFVKRHRVPLEGAPNQVIGLPELFIGAELKIYGRVFRVVDADPATRYFYEEQGHALAGKEEYPTDPFVQKQTAKPKYFNKMMHPMKLFMEALKGKPMSQIESTTKFLKNDGKVLRFYCMWDDANIFGEKRPYVLHYFLADDTIEIVELQQPNSGRDPFPALLKRSKLPKNATSNHPDVSRIGMQGRDEKMTYYTDKDLRVGDSIKVFTRELKLCGCDKFTQEYYVKTYNADADAYHPLEVPDEVEEVPKMLPPPHNGIGTEEDSLGSFLYLMPKVPKQDFKKLMENDGIQLRYLARLHNPQIEDKDRRFIITYYLNNDTVSVFEKFERNSGFIGGKFYERNRAKNPETGEYFRSNDFFLGKVIEFNKHKFEIIEVDEYTKAYLRKKEEDAKQFEAEAASGSAKPKNAQPRINPYVPVTAGFVSAATANMYGTTSINPKIASPKANPYAGPAASVFKAAAASAIAAGSSHVPALLKQSPSGQQGQGQGSARVTVANVLSAQPQAAHQA